ncbi:unnamed protein product [Meloidogyne enterolobii]|uniref:Uncharacterized protein n=1 Tax=Meloidogyne enterolobii TaxID=390850 RepID=A0ACB0YXS7_MELEN
MNDDVFNHAHPSMPLYPYIGSNFTCPFTSLSFFLALSPLLFNTQKLVLSLVTTERDSCFDVKKGEEFVCAFLFFLPFLLPFFLFSSLNNKFSVPKQVPLFK